MQIRKLVGVRNHEGPCQITDSAAEKSGVRVWESRRNEGKIRGGKRKESAEGRPGSLEIFAEFERSALSTRHDLAVANSKQIPEYVSSIQHRFTDAEEA